MALLVLPVLKAHVLFLQLSLVLLLASCCCFPTTVFGDEVDRWGWVQSPDHHHAPTYPPAEAPKGNHHHHHLHHHPKPQRPPVFPFPRSSFAVQGVVYCKSCKYADLDYTLGLGAAPLVGAVVKLQCHNSKYRNRPVVVEGTTDEHGYYLIIAPKRISNYAFRKCEVFLVSSPPAANCSKPTNLHGGERGATLIPTWELLPRRPHPPPHFLLYELFTVTPLAFAPPTKCPF